MNRLLLLRRVYSTFLLSMFCVLAFAQGKQITGVIKDGTGEPMTYDRCKCISQRYNKWYYY